MMNIVVDNLVKEKELALKLNQILLHKLNTQGSTVQA